MDNNRIKQLAILSDYLISKIPNNIKSKDNIISWLKDSPYSPYITLYGGVNSNTYDEDESFISSLDNKRRYKLNDLFSFKLENFINHDDSIYSANTRLYDIINTETLFLAYPEFKDIDISINISNSNNGNYSGSTYHEDNIAQRIEVFADNNENAMRVLLHELQHCIQLRERFEVGASYYGDVGVMDLFVGAIQDENGEYVHGTFSDLATKKTISELDDRKAIIDLSPAIILRDNLNKKIENRVMRLFNQFEEGTLEKEKYDELEKKYISELETNINGIFNLERILEYPELFEEYPEFKAVLVEFTSDTKEGTAHYNSLLNIIKIDNRINIKDIKTYLFHEVQHIIQFNEDWARGGNAKTFDNQQINNNIRAKELEYKLERYEREIEVDAEIIIEKQDLELFKKVEDWTKKNDYPDWMFENEKDKITSYLIDTNKLYKDMYKEMSNLKYGDREDSYSKYKRLWGEQQARATQYRINMSEEERLKESWTETLAKVEGEYNEPIIKYDSTIVEAKVLEDKYLDKDGWVNYDAIEADGLERIPKFFTSYDKFDKLFKNKISDRKALVKTPIGEVVVDTRYSFNHLTNNTYNENRVKYSGAIIKVFEDPLFVVEDEYEGKMQKIYYKPFVSKNKQQGVIDLAGFVVDNNGNMLNTTFFPLNEKKLVKFIECREDRLIYYKHAGPSINAGTPKEGNTRAYSDIVTENTNDVNKNENKDIKFDKNLNNFDNWFDSSRVLTKEKEPLVLYYNKSKEAPIRLYENKVNPFDEQVYLKINKPHKVLGKSILSKDIENAKSLGCDGVIKKSSVNGNEYCVFDVSQIKSIHNKGTFDINNPNILEKNDYGLRHIEKVLSILPDNIKTSTVKDYLLFNGISHEHLRGSVYQNCLDSETFINPIKVDKSNLDYESNYYTSSGEKESRKIEDLYVTQSYNDFMLDRVYEIVLEEEKVKADKKNSVALKC